MDMAIKLGLSVLLMALKESVKNPKKKAALKSAMLNLRDQIDLLYIDDHIAAVRRRR